MGLILYSKEIKESGERLLNVIKEALPGYDLEIYSSIDDLAERLHQPLVDISVAIFHAVSHAELMEVVFLADLLTEMKVVLVLSDCKPETLKKAHIIRPRFIVSSQNDYKSLDSILKRMVKLYGKPY
ncbi:MAG: hypothetical protein EG826_10545 [Deltaproteobacteria bacterium]|nr:hypothetical protein [Deltaproteobacteria bacterium]